MITYKKGNLLEAHVEALVNTVNTVGVMGKGIALMFKERFPKNMTEYSLACKQGKVVVGKMFVTETNELTGARWIINFPTKQHWRSPSKMIWIDEGLKDLRLFIIQNGIKSVAIPPLGAGNGGLNWLEVKEKIEHILSDLNDVEIIVYEPTTEYQNVSKSQGVKKLTPARAMIAELIRRYWILGMECSLLEVQKLAWFLQRTIERQGLRNELNLDFIAQKEIISAYMNSEGKDYLCALEEACAVIDGFESPFGMELLATVDWLVFVDGKEPTVASIKESIAKWPAGHLWAQRKQQLFTDEYIQLALQKLMPSTVRDS